METLPTRSYSLTMPYFSSQPIAPELRREHERVRLEVQDAGITARQALERADRWERDWSEDLDPSPKAVYRTSEAYGEKRSLRVETEDTSGKYQRPSKLVEEKEGKHKSTVLFDKGEVTRIEQSLVGHHGGVEQMTIEVNRATNTIVYSIHETGEFALEPLGFQSPTLQWSGGAAGPVDSSSGRGGFGPDDVFDEFSQGRPDHGPDAVYSDFDHGRGYTFDGPDGRSSYDPYH